jgi:uncharacterized protein (UPF0333 family)
MLNKRAGQNVAEYFLMMVVVLAAIMAIGFLGKVRGVFDGYFNKASTAMTHTSG